MNKVKLWTCGFFTRTCARGIMWRFKMGKNEGFVRRIWLRQSERGIMWRFKMGKNEGFVRRIWLRQSDQYIIGDHFECMHGDC